MNGLCEIKRAKRKSNIHLNTHPPKERAIEVPILSFVISVISVGGM